MARAPCERLCLSRSPGYLYQDDEWWYDRRTVQAGMPVTVQGDDRRSLGSAGSKHEISMTKVTEPQFIESTAGKIAEELARRGIAPDQHVTITIEPDDWLAEVRRYARPRVVAKGWSDADIDRVIEEERKAVQPRLG